MINALVRAGRRSYSLPSSSRPWFVDAEHVPLSPVSVSHSHIHPVPDQAPTHLKALHAELAHSPHLEKSTLVVAEPVPTSSVVPLPNRPPQGRRRRAGLYSGEDVFGSSSGIWNWVLTAQVKEGTEDRGAIESVVRVVRKNLLSQTPPVVLPPNSKRRMHNGWAMIDGGNFAVHIVSKDAKNKYFDHNTLQSVVPAPP